MKHPALTSLLVFFCLALTTQTTLCQNGLPPIGGARSAGMGYTGVTYTDIHSVFTNQAGLAMIDKFAATAFAEQRFFLSELQGISAGAALPTNSGTFGVSVNYFGFEDYNEQRAGLAYGRKLNEKLALGAQLLVLNTSIPEYGNKTNVTFEVGLLSNLLPELQLGFHVYSPARIQLVEDEFLPSLFRLGLNYSPSDKLQILAEVEKNIDYPVRSKFGLEYTLFDAFKMRVGAATEPLNLSFGLGYQLGNGLSLDIASTYHDILGFTPTAGVSYAIQKDNNQ
jgi:hypothetical protein